MVGATECLEMGRLALPSAYAHAAGHRRTVAGSVVVHCGPVAVGWQSAERWQDLLACGTSGVGTALDELKLIGFERATSSALGASQTFQHKFSVRSPPAQSIVAASERR